MQYPTGMQRVNELLLYFISFPQRPGAIAQTDPRRVSHQGRGDQSDEADYDNLEAAHEVRSFKRACTPPIMRFIIGLISNAAIIIPIQIAATRIQLSMYVKAIICKVKTWYALSKYYNSYRHTIR